MSIEHIYAPPCMDGGGGLLAIVVRAAYDTPGVTFFTRPEENQQLAFIRHPAGHVIAPHTHRQVPRVVQRTQEVLFVRRGRLRVTFYTITGERVEEKELATGDTLLLLDGGHGFEVIEEAELLESKTGPYLGREQDKVML